MADMVAADAAMEAVNCCAVDCSVLGGCCCGVVESLSDGCSTCDSITCEMRR